MTDRPGDAAGLTDAAGEPMSADGRAEPVVETLRAHLAGIDQPESGPATLWLSDEATTMHFPLTSATVPALLGQLEELATLYRVTPPSGQATNHDAYDEPDDSAYEPPYEATAESEPESQEQPTRLARWTGWHYSNAMVGRIPPRQRIALFAAVLILLLLITLFTRH